jgi:endonuclease/exonuclease/phosphatase family metal-dependent hydrolase
MRVVTWNLWWRFGADWRARQPAILSTLEGLAPDVAGLQEVWADEGTTQADELGAALGLHAAFAAPSYPPAPSPPEGPDQDGVALGVALLSRWPILRVRQEPLPAPEVPAPVALLATIDHPAGPLHAAVSCVDPGPDATARRAAQNKALAGLLSDQRLDGPLPVLLAADLNAPPGAPELHPFTSALLDTWPGNGDGGHTLSSGNPFAERDSWLIDQRIDYVLVRPGTPGQAVAVERTFLAGRRPVDGTHPSDHYAVVSDLRA